MNSQSYRFQCKNIFYIKNAEMCHICQYVFAYIHMGKKLCCIRITCLLCYFHIINIQNYQ